MYDYYVIKKGDTLDKIATNFNTTTKEIIDINNLQPTYYITEGVKIKVPVTKEESQAFTYYIIKKGDSIYSIAQKYNISPQNLLLLNNLDANKYIYPGQRIIVPKEGINVYLTRMGDSIDTLTDKSHLSYEQLRVYNSRLYLLPDQLIVYKISD